jgi:hypothetical protein
VIASGLCLASRSHVTSRQVPSPIHHLHPRQQQQPHLPSHTILNIYPPPPGNITATNKNKYIPNTEPLPRETAHPP